MAKRPITEGGSIIRAMTQLGLAITFLTTTILVIEFFRHRQRRLAFYGLAGTLKYASSGYGRDLPDFVLYSSAMCAGACVWSKIGAVVYGVSQEDITAYGKRHATEEFKWRACLISCKFVPKKGGLHIPVFGSFLRPECRKLFGYRASKTNTSTARG